MIITGNPAHPQHSPPLSPRLQALSADEIHTAGGMMTTGAIHTGGDLVGRDKTVHIQTAVLQPSRAVPPAPPADFVGRREQLAQLATALTTGHGPPHHAAITALQGMGGIGKTALAQELTMQLESHFTGGSFWADLALHGGSAETILRTWGAFCGADLSNERGPNVLASRVRGLLHARREAQGPLLVVLDDVRSDWLDTARLLKQSLPAGTPLLLTLRNYDLAAALEAQVLRLDVLPENDALELLAARVKQPDLLSPQAAVKTLLQHLGYLPLAIRLAAGFLSKVAHKPGFDLARFVEDVAQRALPLFDAAGGAGLAATFAISYDALTPQQQRIFQHCSVYSPALLTVEHMAGLLELEPGVVETALDALVDVALLAWDRETQGHYLLHPLLRQYGYTLLQQAHNVQHIHRLAGRRLQEKISAPHHSPAPLEFLEEVDQWARAQAWEIYARRASALVGSLDRLGYWDEIDERLVIAQAHLPERCHAEKLAATLWTNRGTLAFKQARWRDAIDFYEQALQIDKQVRDRHRIAQTCNHLGVVYQTKGEWDKAIAYFNHALRTLEQVGDSQRMAGACNNLGIVYQAKGEWDKAIGFYEQALQTFEQLVDSHGMAQTYNNLGIVYHAKGEWQKAIAYHEQALQTFEQLGDRHGAAQTHMGTGAIYRTRGEWAQAIAYFEQALQTFTQLGDKHGMAGAYNNLGSVYGVKGEWQKAIAYHEQSLQTKKLVGDSHGMAQTYNNLGIVYQARSEWQKAIGLYEQALQIYEQVGDSYGMAQTYNNLGAAYDAKGAWEKATGFYRQALQIFEQVGDSHGIASAYGNLGLVYHQQGDAGLAANYTARAYLIFARLKAAPEEKQTGGLLVEILGSLDVANAYLAEMVEEGNP